MLQEFYSQIVVVYKSSINLKGLHIKIKFKNMALGDCIGYILYSVADLTII